MKYLLIGLVRVYQWTLSPLLRALNNGVGGCRFLPTCSEYALEALRYHGAWRGGWLALNRLARCHPWGGHGFDPVPKNDAVVCNGKDSCTCHPEQTSLRGK